MTLRRRSCPIADRIRRGATSQLIMAPATHFPRQHRQARTKKRPPPVWPRSPAYLTEQLQTARGVFIWWMTQPSIQGTCPEAGDSTSQLRPFARQTAMRLRLAALSRERPTARLATLTLLFR